MLKTFNIANIDDCYNQEELNKIYTLIEEGHEKFKFNNDERIIFKDSDIKEIEDYLGVTIYPESFNDYLDYYDGGDYITVGHINIYKEDCIKEIKKNIKQYEDRIMQADDINDEINNIIDEQVYKIANRRATEIINKMQTDLEKVKSGNFKWR